MKKSSNLTATYPTLPELTFRGMFLGMLITVIFTASNVYLGLKVGLTFSSSIPAAVISMAILRMFKNSNILENNMVQTQASAAGTLSAIIFILPGLLMIGYWQGFPFWQTLLLCACGGSLGVLFTIPLRRAMVVNSDLPYPEGRAAAEILKVGSEIRKEEAEGEDTSKKETGMKDIVFGTALAGIFSFCSNGLHIASSEVSHWIHIGKAVTQIPMGFSMALLGAGYLIGITSGIAILCGTLLAWVVFVPYLTSVISPADGQSAAAFAHMIWAQKVRFIGAGCIGIAAIWTLIKLAKPVVDGIKMSIAAIRSNDTEEKQALHHTDIDMSPKSVGIVFLIILAGLFVTFYTFVSAANLPFSVTITYIVVGILVAVLMGFFVAAACGYMAGLIGTSASPISGIGILGIIVSSLVVLALSTSFGVFDLPGGTDFATALAIFITAVIVIIIDALLTSHTTALALPPLAVGMGIYLPPTLEIPLVIGSVMGWLVHRHLRQRAERRSPDHVEEDVEACNHRGVLLASGLIVGESLVGVIIALIIVVSVTSGGSENPLALVGKDFESIADVIGLLAFVGTMFLFIRHIIITKFTPEK